MDLGEVGYQFIVQEENLVFKSKHGKQDKTVWKFKFCMKLNNQWCHEVIISSWASWITICVQEVE